MSSQLAYGAKVFAVAFVALLGVLLGYDKVFQESAAPAGASDQADTSSGLGTDERDYMTTVQGQVTTMETSFTTVAMLQDERLFTNESQQAKMAAEFETWREIRRAAQGMDVPPQFTALHADYLDMLDLLVSASEDATYAVEHLDPTSYETGTTKLLEARRILQDLPRQLDAAAAKSNSQDLANIAQPNESEASSPESPEQPSAPGGFANTRSDIYEAYGQAVKSNPEGGVDVFDFDLDGGTWQDGAYVLASYYEEGDLKARPEDRTIGLAFTNGDLQNGYTVEEAKGLALGLIPSDAVPVGRPTISMHEGYPLVYRQEYRSVALASLLPNEHLYGHGRSARGTFYVHLHYWGTDGSVIRKVEIDLLGR